MKIVRAGLVEPRKFELIEDNIEPAPDEAIVKISACGICSSEIPTYDGSWLRNAPAFLGHEAVGEVVAVGAEVSEVDIGDHVTGEIRSGFATHGVCKAARLIPVSADVPYKHAIGEPLMCATLVTRAASPEFGDHVAVVGCGAMGLLTIAALKSPGLGSLVAVDQLDSRLATASQCGATHTINSAEVDPMEAMKDIAGPTGADVVVEFTGVPGGLELSAKLVRRAGKLIMAGFHHTPATYNLGIFGKGLILHSPHPYGYKPDVLPDYRRAIAALERGVFPMELIVTHEVSLDAIADGFETLIARKPGYLKGVMLNDL